MREYAGGQRNKQTANMPWLYLAHTLLFVENKQVTAFLFNKVSDWMHIGEGSDPYCYEWPRWHDNYENVLKWYLQQRGVNAGSSPDSDASSDSSEGFQVELVKQIETYLSRRLLDNHQPFQSACGNFFSRAQNHVQLNLLPVLEEQGKVKRTFFQNRPQRQAVTINWNSRII